MTLLTVKDVAARVGLSEHAVRRAIYEGELAAFKPRGRLRVYPCDVEAWLEASRVAPQRPVREAGPVLVPAPVVVGEGGFRARTRREKGRT